MVGRIRLPNLLLACSCVHLLQLEAWQIAKTKSQYLEATHSVQISYFYLSLASEITFWRQVKRWLGLGFKLAFFYKGAGTIRCAHTGMAEVEFLAWLKSFLY